MKINCIIFGMGLLILSACSKDSLEYPRKFLFNRANIFAEKGFVIGDNESYREISSKAGNLDTLRTWLFSNLDTLFKNSGGAVIESIELPNKDSVRLQLFFGDSILPFTLPARVNDPNGILVDPALIGANIKYNSSTDEINICQVFELIIEDRGINKLSRANTDFCLTNDVNQELDKFLLTGDFLKNDTIGVYLVNEIYK